MKTSLSKLHDSEYMSCLWDTVIFGIYGEIWRERKCRKGSSKSVLDFRFQSTHDMVALVVWIYLIS